jgi:CPA2 family monovalent cation:H+ antiporter-2
MELVMLLAGAFILGALAQRLRQSPIIGYLLAGTIIGPLLFNAEAVNQSAELGVSLLLFSIGLEFSFNKLRRMGRMAFGSGTAQILVTMGCVTTVFVFFGNLPQALTLGAIVALSSTAVVMRVLVDRAEVDSVRGRTCLGILLVQDIAIVPLVLMVSLLAPTAGNINVGLHILKIVASAVGLAGGCYLLLYHLVPRLLFAKDLFANRELTVLLAVAVGLGASWEAHALGISPALGTFLAGMLLGESPFATQIRSDIGALRTIMVTLFFASVGMLVKPLWFLLHIHWILLAAAAVFMLKSIITFAVTRLLRLDRRYALATGITLAQVGEFSFVLAAAARGANILGGDAFDLIVSVIILLMFAAPYMVNMAIPLADRLLPLWSRKPASRLAPDDEAPFETAPEVLVVGFGPAGRQVVDRLTAYHLQPLVLDVNPRGRHLAAQMGIPFYLGDAAQEEILLHAGLERICLAVVTVPDPATSIRVVEALRRLRPRLPIAARCRYNIRLEDLRQAGADIVVDEETIVGGTLAGEIVSFLQEASGASLACRLSGRSFEDLPEPAQAAS